MESAPLGLPSLLNAPPWAAKRLAEAGYVTAGPSMTPKQQRKIRLAVIAAMTRTLGPAHENITTFASGRWTDGQLLSIAQAHGVRVG